MTKRVKLLIISSHLENRQALLRILEGLPLNVYAIGSIEQAGNTLKQHGIEVVLCDERFCDGTYHDVLALTVDRVPKIQFILLLTHGGPEEYKEAKRLGVAEVIHSPFEPTDIELALMHAVRGQTVAAYAAA